MICAAQSQHGRFILLDGFLRPFLEKKELELNLIESKVFHYHLLGYYVIVKLPRQKGFSVEGATISIVMAHRVVQLETTLAKVLLAERHNGEEELFIS